MLEEMQRLQECPALTQFLDHYAQLGSTDRMVWQARRMSADGIDAAEITRLHGELLAYDWIEMNLGLVTGKEPGGLAVCYRITLSGLRAWKRAQGGFLPLEEEEVAAARRPRRGKRGSEDAAAPEAPAAEMPTAEAA